MNSGGLRFTTHLGPFTGISGARQRGSTGNPHNAVICGPLVNRTAACVRPDKSVSDEAVAGNCVFTCFLPDFRDIGPVTQQSAYVPMPPLGKRYTAVSPGEYSVVAIDEVRIISVPSIFGSLRLLLRNQNHQLEIRSSVT